MVSVFSSLKRHSLTIFAFVSLLVSKSDTKRRKKVKHRLLSYSTWMIDIAGENLIV